MFSFPSLTELTPARLLAYSLAALTAHSFLSRVLKFLRAQSVFPHIPGPPSQSWITGNLEQLFTSKGLPFHLLLSERYGGVARVYGFFGDEQLYICDPRALHSILVKDQDAFDETSVFIENNRVIFGPGLVATVGEQHKRQRKAVKPVFSVMQLKKLTPIFYELAEKLCDVISKEARGETIINGDPYSNADSGRVDMSEWMSRIALETVGQAVLGYSFDPLDSQQINPYTAAVKELIPTLFRLSIVRQFVPWLARIGSPALRRKLVELVPHEAVQKVKNSSDVMYTTARGILESKRERISEQTDEDVDSSRQDIITELLKNNGRLPDSEKLSEEELIGQMTVLIFGAQDTTSSALSRVLYMLSVHPNWQDNLREEIFEALDNSDANGRLSYEDIMTLPLLDAVLKETLRLFPPVPFVRRTAIKERTIPFATQTGDMASITIPVGTTLFLGIASANRLESVWGEDAKEWNPERWIVMGAAEAVDSSSAKNAKLPGIYAGTLSFLGGSRSCVGYKFADIEMKIILVKLLSRFTFAKTGDTIVWNLSQIISPSTVTRSLGDGGVEVEEEKKGLPLLVRAYDSTPSL
ncbi:cytochrome P450 [Pleurotus eryngii]|uniref:Cytochrome P450 n=1 Tax=Pleurotus eryngii TaxID=5323 RepID=A0A9P6D4C5_PLEER|nr:cytochrome P450 [Pleurotus eryngii]